MQNILEKTITWIKNNSGRLLLYAVILTGCFSIKYAAYGKYVDYVKDYTSVTSAPFYFSSNYLEPQEDMRTYVIGSFNGLEYNLDVEVRNADNAYNFNETGTDVYYYVTAELFSDEAMTQPVTNPNLYSTVIKYGKDNANAAGMTKKIKTYETVEVEDPVTHKKKTKVITEKDLIIDSTAATEDTFYNHPDRYKLVGLLKGLPYEVIDGRKVANVKDKGKQSVSITINWAAKQTNPLWLRVTAHTIPATKTVNDTYCNDDDTAICRIDPTKFITGYPASYFPDGYKAPTVETGYENMQGIYTVEVTGTFNLNGKNSEQESDITCDITSSNSDYTILCTLSSTIDTKAKLYFDSSKMIPDDSLGEVNEDPGGKFPTYVNVTLYSSGSKTCYFYKRGLTTKVDKNDVAIVEN